jgi:glycosyltransferase involved in cell wall biosynthesis
METAPEISAMITCYFEDQTIEEFHDRLDAALRATGRSYEIVFVNDGSTDRTFEKLCQLYERNPNISTVIDLFKNAGQLGAMTAAAVHLRGSIVLSMDSDLQLDPEDLPLLLAEYDKGFDVVSGYRERRQDSFWRVLPSRLANIIMRRASNSQLRDFGCTFKLYNAKLIRAFELGPFYFFNPVTIISKAQRCAEVPVSHAARMVGKSGWTFRKLWNYQMEHLISLTTKLFQYIGLAALGLGILFFLRVLVDYVTPFAILGGVSPGLILNTVVIASLILLGAICIIGELAVRTFIASKREPKYIVREIRTRHDRNEF